MPIFLVFAMGLDAAVTIISSVYKIENKEKAAGELAQVLDLFIYFFRI